MLLFVIVVWVLSFDPGARNRARSITKALGARDLSPPARLLTTEKFNRLLNLQVICAIPVFQKNTMKTAFQPVSKAYGLYVGSIFKNSK
jgi:hypothetical protein